MKQKIPCELDPHSVKKILIIRLRRLGDNIMTTPAVTALKQSYPEASLTYIIEEPFREVIEGNPHVDHMIVLPRKQKTGDLIKSIRKIRKTKYDILIDLFGGPKAAWITLFAKARLKAGYAVKYKSFIYHIRIPRSPKTGYIHSAESHLNVVETLGARIHPLPPLFIPEASPKEKKKIDEFIKDHDLADFRIITMHIGAGNEFRDWGPENISELVRLFQQHQEINIILVGAPHEKQRAEQIAEKAGQNIFSLAGQLSLKELRELIKRSVLYIGPDSGPMHLAASTQTPIVAYFGPTLPARFRPWQAKARIIEKKMDCRVTCRQRECVHSDFRCIRTLTPAEVYAACREMLTERP